MVQTTKGGVAPKKEKKTKAQLATEKKQMDAMAEGPSGRREPSDVAERNTAESADTTATTDWVKDHPAGPASPSEAFNSGA